MKILLKIITMLAAAILFGGYLGRFIDLGDSLAVFRLQAALLLATGAAALLFWRVGPRYVVVGALILGAGVTVQIAVGYRGPPVPALNGSEMTLYQKNLLARAWPRYGLADDILATNADVVTLQEVSPHNLRFMAKLFDGYATQLFCDSFTKGQVAILTRFEPVQGGGRCFSDLGLALMQVKDTAGRVIWLASLHMDWPYPKEQGAQARGVAAVLENLDGPVVLGGDFNMVPWGWSIARIARAAKTTRLGPYIASLPMFGPLAPLPIDHVLVPKGATGTTRARPLMGSDHLGILATFRLGD